MPLSLITPSTALQAFPVVIQCPSCHARVLLHTDIQQVPLL